MPVESVFTWLRKKKRANSMSIELSGLSVAELKQLSKDVEKAIKVAAETERKAALSAARIAAQEHGFELDELLGDAGATKAKGKSGAKNPPKYRNPENPEQTWSGRGRRPAWIAEAEATGKSLEDMAI